MPESVLPEPVMPKSVLPNFLGIGAPRAGTTWLYELLGHHPQVVVPAHRKEIHYFDLHFQRGPDWYAGFFGAPPTPAPVAVGELTPHYLYSPEAPGRVAATGGIDRFVLVVRNPLDRAWSHYRFRTRQENLNMDFGQFLAERPEALAWGRYGAGLARWLEVFDRTQFLILVFEAMVADTEATAQALARHLGVDPGGFDTGLAPANESFSPRRRRLYATAVDQARWLRRHQGDRWIAAAKRLGASRVVKARAPEAGQTMDPGVRSRLWGEVADDVALLESLAGLDLGHWRPEAGDPA